MTSGLHSFYRNLFELKTCSFGLGYTKQYYPKRKYFESPYFSVCESHFFNRMKRSIDFYTNQITGYVNMFTKKKFKPIKGPAAAIVHTRSYGCPQISQF